MPSLNLLVQTPDGNSGHTSQARGKKLQRVLFPQVKSVRSARMGGTLEIIVPAPNFVRSLLALPKAVLYIHTDGQLEFKFSYRISQLLHATHSDYYPLFCVGKPCGHYN